MRRIITALALAASIIIPGVSAAAPAAHASCSGCFYLRADDPVYTQYNGWQVKSDVGNQPYYMENQNSTYFRLITCQANGGYNWCELYDSNGHCANAAPVGAESNSVVDSGCADTTPEQWAAIYLGSSLWAFKNRHYNEELSVDTGQFSGNVIFSTYSFSWSRPSA